MLGAWALIRKISKPVFKRKEETKAQDAWVERLDLVPECGSCSWGQGVGVGMSWWRGVGLLGQNGQGVAPRPRNPLGSFHQGVQVVS